MDGAAEQARRTRWQRSAVLAALMPAAFTFDTAENLPIGLLELIADSLRVSVPAVGLLVTGYGVTVAVASVPLAHVMRGVARRHVLTALLAALVVSSVMAALATSYRLLLAARLLTAPAQALFWAVLGPVAVGLFAPGFREGGWSGRCPSPVRRPSCSAYPPAPGWAATRAGPYRSPCRRPWVSCPW